ncbi:CHAT domain-containing protein, partial [Scytonema sp. PCC 10023]|uniref:CHAT domain-containing protein n=1 Tax=Scytonema sp. PCC 10023 TaxID=1680591 RepID=UPI0039C75EE4
DYDSAWNNRGVALGNLGRHEEAIASYDKAIEIKPDYDSAWNNRGVALGNLGRYEDAVASYNKAIEIKPDDDSAWYNRGVALGELGRYEEALASYDKAIEIKPDYDWAWNNRAVALNNLRLYTEAIASFDEALRLRDYQFWLAWNNRGLAVLYSQGYKAAVKTWDDGIKALKPQTPDYEQGCGELHRRKGETLYEYAQDEPNPFPDWFEAKASYEQALNFLSFEKFRLRHLQVLEEFLKVCSALGDNQTFARRLEEGTQRLEQLVRECEFQGEKISLARKFAAFDQLRVDIRLQSNNINKEIAALELAEKRKNTCLAWLREGWDYQPPKFHYKDMQKLLNPKTAAIYWHISPVAITTFIIKHNQLPKVLSPVSHYPTPNPSPQARRGRVEGEGLYLAHLHQLQRFEGWMQKWKQAYQDYCQGNYTSAAKETAPWRQDMEDMLLNELRDVLEIHRLRDYLKDVDHLILIPHRELHLLPLDYLFPKRFTITYLPSFQIGLKLLAQPFNQPLGDNPTNIVNVGNSELPFDNIESVALASLYPGCRQLQIPPVKQKALIDALRENTGLFHFTGHGDHIPEQPRESFLMLAEPDKLTLGDIVDDDELDFSQYQLICLSACETGITSQESLVDEYVGLVSGFLAKGANYVVSTLWRVDERSTAILMIKFYQLLKQKESPAAALKQAKDWLRQLTYEGLAKWYCDLAKELYVPVCRKYLETEALIIENDPDKMTSSEPVYAHPYYWAGFILTGKPV